METGSGLQRRSKDDDAASEDQLKFRDKSGLEVILDSV